MGYIHGRNSSQAKFFLSFVVVLYMCLNHVVLWLRQVEIFDFSKDDITTAINNWSRLLLHVYVYECENVWLERGKEKKNWQQLSLGTK